MLRPALNCTALYSTVQHWKSVLFGTTVTVLHASAYSAVLGLDEKKNIRKEWQAPGSQTRGLRPDAELFAVQPPELLRLQTPAAG